jgi:predicted DNA-binding WGR domain protein
VNFEVFAEELVDVDELSNTSKFWRLYMFADHDDLFVAHWGRVGTVGDIKVHEKPVNSSNSLRKSKLNKGYNRSVTTRFFLDHGDKTKFSATEFDYKFKMAAPARALPTPSTDKVAATLAALKKLEQRLR